ncbi:AAA family ATPase [uncultured Ruminococcus sp.]|uniref:AAA family ATPase n=1 Tax=uncultured Ruminococcus sp. TaxID=165186 RepID=UPI0026720DDF|nr:AAA family ATPase [uncultured Ruminococcus sp.]
MSNTNQFDWVAFYKELASKLLQFKGKRDELVTNVLKIYEITGINMPTLEKDNNIVDIDPFTVFGLFNKSSMKETNRVKILTAVADLFSISAPVPTSFDSIPVLNNQNATFYYFVGDRENGDIDDLWNLFSAALAYAADPTADNRKTLSKYFDLTINKKGNGNSKITMGIYWIAPNSFLNLDQRNTWYIYESGKIPSDLVGTLPAIEAKIPSAKYFDIVEKLRSFLQSDKSTLKDFKELSFEAWRYSEEVNEEKRKEKAQAERESKGAALADDDVETTHYWIYSPGDGATIWDECYNDGIMAIGWDSIGNLRAFTSKDEMKLHMKETIDPSKSYKNAAYATWQFANDMKPGDIVFAKKGMHLIVGRGIVESDYEYDPSRKHYKNIRKVKWTHKGEWEHPGQAVMKTLTDITSYKDYVDKLNAIFESDVIDDVDEQEFFYPPYDAEKFLEEVYMDEENYDTLVALVLNKKNVILQGAPGVGKTFAAKRLAYSIMGVKDPNRVMMVQFHQGYSYEDFIMGFRPSEKGFELKHGAFYNFCKEAEIDSENEYFFIIDEINRGNLSKIFGELFMLIESDKRGVELQLLYSDEKFSVPSNVYIIGMMNTADRSLAMLDYALRRRFAFYEMKPGFDSDGFHEYRINLASEKFDRLINCVENLNSVIAADDSLGEGFCIGHSYFCNLKEATDQALSSIVEFELIPLLKEYWFDETTKVKDWTNNLRSAIK